MKKNICIIPARSGSKNIKDKNIQLLNGLPLIAWTIRDCLKIKKFSRVIFSTDSIRYARIARNFGAEVPFLRSKKNSGDKSTDYDFLNEIIKFYENKNVYYDYITHMRPTTPLRKIKILNKCLDYFYKNEKKIDSIRSVQPMSESCYKNFIINKNKDLIPVFNQKKNLDYFNKPKEFFPKTYSGNGYIDIYKTKNLAERSLYGKKTKAFVTEFTVEVDNIADLEYLRTYSNKRT